MTAVREKAKPHQRGNRPIWHKDEGRPCRGNI